MAPSGTDVGAAVDGPSDIDTDGLLVGMFERIGDSVSLARSGVLIGFAVTVLDGGVETTGLFVGDTEVRGFVGGAALKKEER